MRRVRFSYGQDGPALDPRDLVMRGEMERRSREQRGHRPLTHDATNRASAAALAKISGYRVVDLTEPTPTRATRDLTRPLA